MWQSAFWALFTLSFHNSSHQVCVRDCYPHLAGTGKGSVIPAMIPISQLSSLIVSGANILTVKLKHSLYYLCICYQRPASISLNYPSTSATNIKGHWGMYITLSKWTKKCPIFAFYSRDRRPLQCLHRTDFKFGKSEHLEFTKGDYVELANLSTVLCCSSLANPSDSDCDHSRLIIRHGRWMLTDSKTLTAHTWSS